MGGAYYYDCTKFTTNNRNCNINAWDEDILLAQMFNGQTTQTIPVPLGFTVPYSTNGIYVFIAGTDVVYTSTTSTGSSVMGQSSLCGRQDVQSGSQKSLNGATAYVANYAIVPIPGAGSTCNMLPSYAMPNADSVDNTILFLAHELVEA